MKDDLLARMYNGLDERVGYPVIVCTKPIMPVTEHSVVPVGDIHPRAQVIKYPMPRKTAQIPWWRRLIKEVLGI